MPDFSGGVATITTDLACQDAGGLLTIFVADAADVDWTAMATANNYTDADYEIQSWVMLNSAKFYEFQFYAKNGRLDNLFEKSNGFYQLDIPNLLFRGNAAARTIAINKLKNACNLVGQVFQNNGVSRVVGREHISSAWVTPLEPLSLSRHLETSGGFGSEDDKARDEIDLSAQHRNTMAYSAVTLATMRAM